MTPALLHLSRNRMTESDADVFVELCVYLNELLRWDQSELLSPQATSSNLSLGVTPRSCFVVACVDEKRFCRLARFWCVWLICACFLKLNWRVLEWTLNTERVIFVSPAAQSTIIDRSADIHTTDRRSRTPQHLLHCLPSAELLMRIKVD